MSQPARPTRLNRNAVLRARGAEAQVGRHRDDRAGARADAVDRGDDRLRAGAHRLDQVAGHAGEHQELGRLQPHQRADDLVHVAAGAEVPARAGEHDRMHVVGMAQPREQVAQLGVGLEGERVLALGPVQRDRGRRRRSTRPGEMLGLRSRPADGGCRRQAGSIAARCLAAVAAHDFLSSEEGSLSAPGARAAGRARRGAGARWRRRARRTARAAIFSCSRGHGLEAAPALGGERTDPGAPVARAVLAHDQCRPSPGRRSGRSRCRR